MSEAEHRELREQLGAYALDVLDAAAAARVEEHLATCPDCRAELAEITPAAEALGDLRAAGRPSPEEPDVPDGLGARVVDLVEAERRRDARSRWTRTLATTGVGAAAAGIVVVAGLRLTADRTPDVPREAVTLSEGSAGIAARADVVAHTWGVEVQLRGSGFVAGEHYRVTVRSTDGVEHPAGGFVGTGEDEMDCSLSSPVLRTAATGFEVRDPSGAVLVSSRF